MGDIADDHLDRMAWPCANCGFLGGDHDLDCVNYVYDYFEFYVDYREGNEDE